MKQTADTLVYDPHFKTGATITLKLDGSESTNVLPDGTVKSKASLRGDTLSASSSGADRDGKPMTFEDTWTVKGDVLTMTSTRTGKPQTRVFNRIES